MKYSEIYNTHLFIIDSLQQKKIVLQLQLNLTLI